MTGQVNSHRSCSHSSTTRRHPNCCWADRSFPPCRIFCWPLAPKASGPVMTSWASYGGEQLLREAIGVPDGWLVAGHIVVGWPEGKHGPLRRRPLAEFVNLDHWDQPAGDFSAAARRTGRRTELHVAVHAHRYGHTPNPRLSPSGRENVILARAATTGGGPNAVGVRC